MTNSEKYLKDGVKEQLIKELSIYGGELDEFFEEQVKPKLTEDERIILRNIDKDYYKFIGRQAEMLYVSHNAHYFNTDSFDNYFGKGCLFQFIKERRRILY